MQLLAASQPPAAGAGLDQVALATGGAAVATAILLWICISHRNGRIKWLGRLAGFAATQLLFDRLEPLDAWLERILASEPDEVAAAAGALLREGHAIASIGRAG